MKRIFTDGASRGNPGPAAIAFIVEGDPPDEHSVLLEGEKTNNEAEYHAVLEAILYAVDHYAPPWRDIEIISDSQLVVEQMTGRWNINKPELQKLADDIRHWEIVSALNVTYKWASRADPMMRKVDNLCNEALDTGKHSIGRGAWGYDVKEHTWTVGKLVKALEFLKDDTPVEIGISSVDGAWPRTAKSFIICNGDNGIVLEVVSDD